MFFYGITSVDAKVSVEAQRFASTLHQQRAIQQSNGLFALAKQNSIMFI